MTDEQGLMSSGSIAMVKFGVKLLFGGIVISFLGVVFFIQGMTQDNRNGEFTGHQWRGPLMVLAGIAASVMGIRMLSEDSRPPSNPGNSDQSNNLG